MNIIIPFSSSPNAKYRNGSILRCLGSLCECEGDFLVTICDSSKHEIDWSFARNLPINVEIARIQPPFNRSAAVNRVAEKTAHDTICKLDADITVPINFLDRIRECYFPIAFFRNRDGSGTFRHTAAPVFAMSTELFLSMKLDELMGMSWGGEDLNLMYRCLDIGLNVNRTNEDGLIHHWHPTNLIDKNTDCDHSDITIIYADICSNVQSLVDKLKKRNPDLVCVSVSGQDIRADAYHGYMPRTQWDRSRHRLLLGCPYWQTTAGAWSTNIFAEHYISDGQLDIIYNYRKQSAGWFLIDNEVVAIRMRAYDFNHIRVGSDRKMSYREIHDYMIATGAPSEWIKL